MFLSGRRGIKQCGALLGVAETGVAPTPTSKNPSTAKNQNKKICFIPCLGDADTHAKKKSPLPTTPLYSTLNRSG